MFSIKTLGMKKFALTTMQLKGTTTIGTCPRIEDFSSSDAPLDEILKEIFLGMEEGSNIIIHADDKNKIYTLLECIDEGF